MAEQSVAEAILTTAASLFAEHGVRGASLGDIARALSISKGTLYYYFPTKQDVITAVAERTLHEIGDRIFAWVDTVKRDEDPTVALEDLCDALLGERELLRVFIAINSSSEAGDELEKMLDRAMGEWNVMLEVGILRMQPAVAERMKRILAAILPFMCGLAAMNADPDYAKQAFSALVLG